MVIYWAMRTGGRTHLMVHLFTQLLGFVPIRIDWTFGLTAHPSIRMDYIQLNLWTWMEMIGFRDECDFLQRWRVQEIFRSPQVPSHGAPHWGVLSHYISTIYIGEFSRTSHFKNTHFSAPFFCHGPTLSPSNVSSGHTPSRLGLMFQGVLPVVQACVWWMSCSTSLRCKQLSVFQLYSPCFYYVNQFYFFLIYSFICQAHCCWVHWEDYMLELQRAGSLSKWVQQWTCLPHLWEDGTPCSWLLWLGGSPLWPEALQ